MEERFTIRKLEEGATRTEGSQLFRMNSKGVWGDETFEEIPEERYAGEASYEVFGSRRLTPEESKGVLKIYRGTEGDCDLPSFYKAIREGIQFKFEREVVGTTA
jgi:hypothetical protein